MAILSLLADLIHQCRLARCEEDDSTIETHQIPAHESFAFGRLVCAGHRALHSSGGPAGQRFDRTGRP